MPTLLLASLLLVPADRDAVEALRLRVKKAATDARPAVALILVSRSDAYAKAPFWGVTPPTEPQGQLGRFDPEAAAKLVPTSAPQRGRILRTIAQHDLSDPTLVPESYGSGFVLDKSGLILTNAHVVKDATKIYVRLPGRRGSWADIHASDGRSDLAVLRLLDPLDDLTTLPLGKGEDVRTGDFVVSLANAFAPGGRGDAEPTVGYGLVSQLRRRIEDKSNTEAERHKAATLHHYGTLIQTDAATTPGCSGGVLLSLDGKVVGLTTALAGIKSDRPGGFAIPLDANTRRIVEVLKRGEEVEYGFLGVELHGPGDGVYIRRVMPGSPAARGRLQTGDKIVAVNGHAIRENDDLFLYVGLALAGSEVVVEVSRGFGPTRTCNVKLAKFHVHGPPVLASKRPPARFGLRVDHSSTKVQRDQFPNWNRTVPDGVVVREVVPKSPADAARLEPDKVITHVNGKHVSSPEEYYREVAQSPGKKVELTYLKSDNRAETLTLEEK